MCSGCAKNRSGALPRRTLTTAVDPFRGWNCVAALAGTVTRTVLPAVVGKHVTVPRSIGRGDIVDAVDHNRQRSWVSGLLRWIPRLNPPAKP